MAKTKFVTIATLTSLVATAWSSSLPASAAPVRLQCALTYSGADGKDMTRAIALAFDSEANTISVDDGTKHWDLGHVKISTISVNGYTADISVGIERSSLAIVFQTYSQTNSVAEFGICKQLGAPTH